MLTHCLSLKTLRKARHSEATVLDKTHVNAEKVDQESKYSPLPPPPPQVSVVNFCNLEKIHASVLGQYAGQDKQQ